MSKKPMEGLIAEMERLKKENEELLEQVDDLLRS